jgi:hypothetical protein
MAKYTDIKDEHAKRYAKLFDKCHVFWAFSDEQMKEGKAKNPIKEGEKYVSIGSGGFMPKSNFDELQAGLTAIKKWKAQAMKEVKAEEAILYELNNYEAFYSGEIDDVIDALDGKYTAEEIRKVYKKYQTLAGSIEKANEGSGLDD